MKTTKGKKKLSIKKILIIISGVIAVFVIIKNNSKIKTKVVLDSFQLKRKQDSSAIIARTNLKKLDMALIKENQELAKKYLKSFIKLEDEFKGTAFYTDPRTPYYTNVNFIFPYIMEKNGTYWLRLRFQYASDYWLFIDKGILLIDGELFTITGNWKRDNNSGIWEWLDMQVGTSERLILDKLKNSKSAKVRYEGSENHKDRTITSKEKNIIEKTLEIYDNLIRI